MTGLKSLTMHWCGVFGLGFGSILMYVVHVLYLNVQCFDVTRKRARNENKSAKTVQDFFL